MYASLTVRAGVTAVSNIVVVLMFRCQGGVGVKALRIVIIFLLSSAFGCGVAFVFFAVDNSPVGCSDNTGARELQSIAKDLGQRTGAQSTGLGDLGGCSSGLARPAFIEYLGTTRGEVSGRFGSVGVCRQANDGRFECEVQGLSVIVVLSSTTIGVTDATIWLE
jgi:hypothetical protein